MQVMRTEVLVRQGSIAQSAELQKVLDEVTAAIATVVWPVGSRQFAINPIRKGNGVKPIKNECMAHLHAAGWQLEQRLRISSETTPGPLDAVKQLANGQLFALEWETGNISSSHRAVNKMALGMLKGVLVGGILLLPSRKLYRFLTDRIGNFQEIAPYFETWKALQIDDGFLAIIEIEHDAEDSKLPLCLFRRIVNTHSGST